MKRKKHHRALLVRRRKPYYVWTLREERLRAGSQVLIFLRLSIKRRQRGEAGAGREVGL